MDSLPTWLVVLLVIVGIFASIALPISLLFWQAARDQRAANKKIQR